MIAVQRSSYSDIAGRARLVSMLWNNMATLAGDKSLKNLL
jgi:hypothetical protein